MLVEERSVELKCAHNFLPNHDCGRKTWDSNDDDSNDDHNDDNKHDDDNDDDGDDEDDNDDDNDGDDNADGNNDEEEDNGDTDDNDNDDNDDCIGGCSAHWEKNRTCKELVAHKNLPAVFTASW